MTLYGWLADVVLLLHAAFVLFVVAGGLLLWWKPRLMLLHLFAATWGALVEFSGWLCPLTPLENWLRLQGGEQAYRDSFLAHYLEPLLYPGALTREWQVALGTGVVVVNVAVYWWWWRHRTRRGSEDGPVAP
jgi:hypothetical protein